MYEFYIKEVPIVDLKKEDYDYSIIQSILEAQKKLDLAHKNFEYARGDFLELLRKLAQTSIFNFITLY